jgi:gluconate 5-dehydrogenase
MMRDFSLENEIALITGGGTGLGLGIAECFVEAGARVVLVGRREEVLREACGQLPAATYEVQDVTQHEAVPGWLERVARDVGPVSILVNCAGIHLKKAAVETSVLEFDEVIQTHLVAAHNLSRCVLPSMLERKHGNLLFIASMASYFGIPQVVAYSAAKSAYMGMVRTLSVEVSAHGVRVNGIAPGWIDTPMLQRALSGDESRKKRILDRTPMCCFGDRRDIGLAATYLCSPAAKFVTGTVLPVDGGASIGF